MNNFSHIIIHLSLSLSPSLSLSLSLRLLLYSGASTSARSVQLNLREYPKYSKTTIVECTGINNSNIVTKDNQAACKLAVARGKQAVVRVGGGEIFNDVVTSVWAYRDDNATFAKYMMLHGVGKFSVQYYFINFVVIKQCLRASIVFFFYNNTFNTRYCWCRRRMGKFLIISSIAINCWYAKSINLN